jgi:hypothetical protein
MTIPSSQVPIPATRPDEETLTFSIPNRLPIERFDEITVIVHPADGRTWVGSKISIKNFTLVPH